MKSLIHTQTTPLWLTCICPLQAVSYISHPHGDTFSMDFWTIRSEIFFFIFINAQTEHMLLADRRGRQMTTSLIMSEWVCISLWPKYLMNQWKMLMRLAESNHWLYHYNWLIFAVNKIQDGCHSQMIFKNIEMARINLVFISFAKSLLWFELRVIHDTNSECYSLRKIFA